MFVILTVIVVLAAIVLILVMLWDSNRFVKVSYQVRDGRIRQRMKIVLLADLHNKEYGRKNCKLLEAIEASGPDAV